MASKVAWAARGEQVYEYVRDYVAEHGWAPSIREIADAVGVRSTSTAHGYVIALVLEGRLVRDPRRPRAMRVVER